MNNKDLPTTKQNAAEDVILIIQEATTKVKEAVIMGRNVQPIIEEYAAMINDAQLRIETYNALITSARKWEYETRVSIAVFSRGNKQVVNAGFRGFLDNARTGVPVVKDYQAKVRQAIKALSAEPPKIVTTKNGKAYTMSIRNRAEMQVRYETNLKEIEEFKAGGVEYVWLSSHANASPRCAPHQGKLYSINADNKSGKLNGNSYSYLPAVLKLNNGNSILNGYNCRHRAVEYMEGSKPPNDFNAREIKREYAIDQKQRRYENNIRQMKTEEKLLKSTSDSEFIKEANRLRQRRIIAQKQYEIYSLKSGRAYYSWRTQVGRDE